MMLQMEDEEEESLAPEETSTAGFTEPVNGVDHHLF